MPSIEASNIVRRMEDAKRNLRRAKGSVRENELKITSLTRDLKMHEDNHPGLVSAITRRESELTAAIASYVNAGEWLTIAATDPEQKEENTQPL